MFDLIRKNKCTRKLIFNAFHKFWNFSFLKSEREGGEQMCDPSLATTPTGAHDVGHNCLFSSGLWEMTQFDMSSVNRYCVLRK